MNLSVASQSFLLTGLLLGSLMLTLAGSAAAHLRSPATAGSLRRTEVLIQGREPNCFAIWLPGLDSNQN